MTQAFTHYIEGLIFLNNLYENYRINEDAVYFWKNETFVNLTTNKKTNNIMNLLRSESAVDICKKIYSIDITKFINNSGSHIYIKTCIQRTEKRI